MIDADINDISIEIPDESKTIEKPDGAPSTSGEKSIQRQKTAILQWIFTQNLKVKEKKSF